MKVRTLIVDDEELARERLRQLLAEQPELELVGECADGREAVAAIQKQAPDLIFLDIQMPELDGFEVHALDYLLKPFDRERFESSLRRALDQVKRREAPIPSQTQAAATLT